ncbi:hypothetical protein Tsubulata_011203 [Turnera subulata]|uniref:DUF4283 domain-containing protein n=1 Tax=Turnera subulata TaxID=218843 RepID=A0A9Q0JGY9_9ROSI|nr:hypothetical protein Tsubulata_011203 [Turnera subulata]
MWRIKGDFRVTAKPNNFFILGFEFEEDHSSILAGTPWLVADSHVNFRQWLPDWALNQNYTYHSRLQETTKVDEGIENDFVLSFGPWMLADQTVGKYYPGLNPNPTPEWEWLRSKATPTNIHNGDERSKAYEATRPTVDNIALLEGTVIGSSQGLLTDSTRDGWIA